MSDCPNCAVMREALEYVAFDFDPDEVLGPPCGPEALKKIQQALSPDCGRALAERVAKLEAVAVAAQHATEYLACFDCATNCTPSENFHHPECTIERDLSRALAALDADKGA